MKNILKTVQAKSENNENKALKGSDYRQGTIILRMSTFSCIN